MIQPKLAYLINQYPKISHTFIRREILALEEMGLTVNRFSVRGWENELTDPIDEAERLKTRYLLKEGVRGLLRSGFEVFVGRPVVFAKTLRTALRMGVRADRPWPYHLFYLLEACKALQWFERENIKHVHAHFGGNSAEVAMLVQLLGGPTYSLTIHGSEEFDKPEFIHLGLKVQHALFSVAISSYCRSQLYRCIPYAHWKKIKLIRCAIEPDFHHNSYNPAPGNNRLVCVGRFCEQKGQLLLLEAAAKLKARSIDFQLVLAGDGEMRPEIEQQIEQLKLHEHVHITGWINSTQVRDEILKSRALVLASFAEGLPVVIMEAMALRRPVISTCITGIPELVVHGSNGYLCPAGDVDALAANMEACLKASDDAINSFGEHAQNAVLKHHNMITEAKKLAALFAEVGLSEKLLQRG